MKVQELFGINFQIFRIISVLLFGINYRSRNNREYCFKGMRMRRKKFFQRMADITGESAMVKKHEKFIKSPDFFLTKEESDFIL